MPNTSPLTKIVLTEYHVAGFVEVYGLFENRIVCTRGSVWNIFQIEGEVMFRYNGRYATQWVARDNELDFKMVSNRGRLRKKTKPTWSLELLREKRDCAMRDFEDKNHFRSDHA